MNSVKRVKLDSKMIKQICTHSGSFHADESLAVYMLRLLPEYKDAKLVRSRNPKDWEASDILVDVGAQYDGVKFFDHHQRGFFETFNENYKTKLAFECRSDLQALRPRHHQDYFKRQRQQC